jgi:hypothetical protein
MANGGQAVDVTECWEGRTSAWRLRVTVWPDSALEVTTKLTEAGMVGGGWRRCLANVTVRWWSFSWLLEARATFLLLRQVDWVAWTPKMFYQILVDVVQQMDGQMSYSSIDLKACSDLRWSALLGRCWSGVGQLHEETQADLIAW